MPAWPDPTLPPINLWSAPSQMNQEEHTHHPESAFAVPYLSKLPPPKMPKAKKAVSTNAEAPDGAFGEQLEKVAA